MVYAVVVDMRARYCWIYEPVVVLDLLPPPSSLPPK